MTNIYNDLKKWSYLPTENDFYQIERFICTELPKDYKLFMNTYNNFISKEKLVYCYNVTWQSHQEPYVQQGLVAEWLPICSDEIRIDNGEENPPSILLTMLEALKNYRDSDFPRVPIDTIPISSGGDGDKVLIGIGEKNNGKIYYWVMNFEEESDEPDFSPSYNNVGLIADSFTEFINSLYPAHEAEKS